MKTFTFYVLAGACSAFVLTVPTIVARVAF